MVAVVCIVCPVFPHCPVHFQVFCVLYIVLCLFEDIPRMTTASLDNSTTTTNTTITGTTGSDQLLVPESWPDVLVHRSPYMPPGLKGCRFSQPAPSLPTCTMMMSNIGVSEMRTIQPHPYGPVVNRVMNGLYPLQDEEL